MKGGGASKAADAAAAGRRAIAATLGWLQVHGEKSQTHEYAGMPSDP